MHEVPVLTLVIVAVVATAGALPDPFPQCDAHDHSGCRGSADSRAQKARELVKSVAFGGDWSTVREKMVSACGLKVQSSTSHCFEDFNHVDCCTMQDKTSQRTNEKSQVEGMHEQNFLGSHIVDGSLQENGPGGSWCTCQLGTPRDVCHQQFGAEPAFKLVWCHGTTLAVAVTDAGEVLNSGRPKGSAIPGYGAQEARRDAWRIIQGSNDLEYKQRIYAACKQAEVHERDAALKADL